MSKFSVLNHFLIHWFSFYFLLLSEKYVQFVKNAALQIQQNSKKMENDQVNTIFRNIMFFLLISNIFFLGHRVKQYKTISERINNEQW